MRLPYVVEHLSSPILCILKACRTGRDLFQVHSSIIRRGYEQDHFLIAQFISLGAAILPGNILYINSVFNSVSEPSIYLWNIMMKMHCESSSLDDCFLLFRRMRQGPCVVPDKYTFPSCIKACGSAVALWEGRIVHASAIRAGVDTDVFVGSSLIDCYGKCREIDCARKVFDEMHIRNEVSWTAMMVAYINSGDTASATCLFNEMPKKNHVTWNAMIKAFMKLGDLKNAQRVFDSMPLRDEVSYTTLLDGYAKAGDMAAARSLFHDLPRKDLVSWSALISGYVQNGKPYEALKVYSKMCTMNVKPDEFIMVSLMSACSQIGSLDLAKWMESHIRNKSFDPKGSYFAAALVDMNAKCGNMARATLLFETMAKKDLIAYCSMMQGLCIHGQVSKALALFDRMINEGIAPDTVAFTVALTACSQTGLVDNALQLFDLMTRKYSIDPSPDHYACMVNILGKSGKLRAAYQLIQSTSVELHASAWGALLGACKLHGNVELGEVIACKLFEIEPRNAGNYVLLSNIYAEANRWLNVVRLRDRMSEKGVRKVPGVTYLETGA